MKKEGRKGERKDGREGKREGGRKEGRKHGRKEARKKGKKAIFSSNGWNVSYTDQKHQYLHTRRQENLIYDKLKKKLQSDT